MADIIVQSLFHLLGHGLPSLVTKLVFDAPLAILDTISSDVTVPPRQGAWLVSASAGNQFNHKKHRKAIMDAKRRNGGDSETTSTADASVSPQTFDSMSFFGFEPNTDVRRSAYGFTSKVYPYPQYSGHYHTIIGGSRKSFPSKKMNYEREVTNSSFDNNTLFLEWKCCDARRFPEGPKGVIAIVPGLCSGPNTSYMQRFVLHATRSGFHCVVMSIRGMGSAPLEFGNLTAGTFLHDIKYTLEEYLTPDYMEKRFGDKNMKLIAVGFSLGAAMLTSYLGQCPDSRLYCAVAAQAPWDFHRSTAQMGTRFAKIFYQPALAKGLWNVVRKTGHNVLEHSSSVELKENVARLMTLMKKKNGMARYTVNDFDRLIVAPSQGYSSAEDYYTAASPFQHLPKVSVPLMCFNAQDDPITGPPPPMAEWNAVCDTNHNILFMNSPSGGHLGFMRGPLDEMKKKPGYMDELIVDALSAAVNNEAMLKARDSHRPVSTAAEF